MRRKYLSTSTWPSRWRISSTADDDATAHGMPAACSASSSGSAPVLSGNTGPPPACGSSACAFAAVARMASSLPSRSTRIAVDCCDAVPITRMKAPISSWKPSAFAPSIQAAEMARSESMSRPSMSKMAALKVPARITACASRAKR